VVALDVTSSRSRFYGEVSFDFVPCGLFHVCFFILCFSFACGRYSLSCLFIIIHFTLNKICAVGTKKDGWHNHSYKTKTDAPLNLFFFVRA
jgi:hypothetical protein